MSHLTTKAAAEQRMMHVSIGAGSDYSATIGAAIVLSRPAKFITPITRPRYSVWKKVTVVKYRKQKATEMLNLARSTSKGTISITPESTEIIKSKHEIVHVT